MIQLIHHIKVLTINKSNVHFWTLLFICVPGMALIQLEINQPQVFTAKCNEPQVVVSDGKDGGSGVVILLSVRTET